MEGRMSKKSLVLVLAVFVVSAALSAQATKTVTSHNGVCQVTVPASWQVNAMFGSAKSADKKVSVSLSSPIHSTSLHETTQSASMMYPGDKVVKSTAGEFQMEGVSMNNKPNVYRGIQLPGKVCIVEVIYEAGTADDARRIALSLKAGK
jgi:hypothetical protein